MVDELWLIIFTFLPAKSTFHLRLLSRFFSDILRTPSVDWRCCSLRVCTDEILRCISSPTIMWLDVSYSSISDTGFCNLSKTNITTLRARRCGNMSDEGLEYLSTSSLERLDVSECHFITDEGLSKLRASRITSLIVNRCNLITDEGLYYLSMMPLRFLCLDNCLEIYTDYLCRQR